MFFTVASEVAVINDNLFIISLNDAVFDFGYHVSVRRTCDNVQGIDFHISDFDIILRLTYAFNAHLYTILRTRQTREKAVNPIYSYWQPSVGIGFGAELSHGFHMYAEPFFYRTTYDDKQWVVKNNQFTQIRERDFVQRYSVSLSNNKFDIYGFVPTITLSYTKRDSNIWQREYKKTTLEFTFQQRF